MTALPRWMKTAALAMALAMPLAATAQEPARTIAGVAYPAQAGVGGQTLQLNGAGIRDRAIFKVYTAGMYLERPAASLQEIAALPGPKRVSVTMLRDIDSAELGKLFARGIEDNMARARFSRLVPCALRMSDIFTQHKKLLPGESLSVDWVPG